MLASYAVTIERKRRWRQNLCGVGRRLYGAAKSENLMGQKFIGEIANIAAICSLSAVP